MPPQSYALGVVMLAYRYSTSAGDPETLVERLEAALSAVRAQVVLNPQICGAVRPWFT